MPREIFNNALHYAGSIEHNREDIRRIEREGKERKLSKKKTLKPPPHVRPKMVDTEQSSSELNRLIWRLEKLIIATHNLSEANDLEQQDYLIDTRYEHFTRIEIYIKRLKDAMNHTYKQTYGKTRGRR